MVYITHDLSQGSQRIVLHEWSVSSPASPTIEGGDTDVVLVFHSNGFQVRCNEPMIERLLQNESATSSSSTPILFRPTRFFGLDFRGHGDSTPIVNYKQSVGYDTFSADAMRAVDLIRTRIGPRARVHGFGHSLGGRVLLLTEIQNPGTFASIFVFEPNVVTPIFRKILEVRSPRHRPASDDEIPLVKATLSRRDGFDSPEDALAFHQTRSPFKHFDPACLKAYLDTGLEL